MFVDLTTALTVIRLQTRPAETRMSLQTRMRNHGAPTATAQVRRDSFLRGCARVDVQ